MAGVSEFAAATAKACICDASLCSTCSCLATPTGGGGGRTLSVSECMAPREGVEAMAAPASMLMFDSDAWRYLLLLYLLRKHSATMKSAMSAATVGDLRIRRLTAF